MNACIQPLSNLGRDRDRDPRSRGPAMGARRRDPSKSTQCRAYRSQATDRVQRGQGWIAIDSIALSAFR